MTKKNESPNDDNLPAVAEPDSFETIVEKVDLNDETDRRDLLFMLHVTVGGLSPTAAARKMGMHQCSGPRLWKSLNNQKQGRTLLSKFIESIQNTYRTQNAMKLERLSNIEGKVLDMLEKDPAMVAKFPSLFRQIKVVGGVLSDPLPQQPLINIGQVANLMLNAGPITKEFQPMAVEEGE
jgi:hypothetical protein